MQYTGMKDKTGREIYEGDVVVVEGKQKKKVFYSEEDGAFAVMSSDEIADVWYFFDFGLSEEVEVIGNIYEHPQLLTKPEEV
jgi:uncharacterized phage protein (TIGR01671 family)